MARTARRMPANAVPSDEVLARERKVLELKRAGLSFDDIAEQVGYSNGSAAYKAMRRALSRTLQMPAAELRDLEQDRLDRLLLAVWPKALRGDLAAADRVLRISESRRRLLGLDHADGLAERAVAMSERWGELLIGSMQAFLRQMGLENDERAHRAAAEMFWRIDRTLELEDGDGDDVVDAEIVPEPEPRRAPAAKKAAPRPRKATAARPDKEPR